ncbi:MAG: DUF1294 domain-containing protein [Aureispira sp.]
MFPLVILSYLLLVNLLAFILMGWDKRQAKRKAWRQSEKSLLTIAAVGGSIGMEMGSRFWRHKTYKQSFRRPFYGIVALQLLLLIGGSYWYWQL